MQRGRGERKQKMGRERGGVDGVSGGEEVKGKASLTEVAEHNEWPIRDNHGPGGQRDLPSVLCG